MTLGPGARPSRPPPTGGVPDIDHAIWLNKVREWWRWHEANPEVWECFRSFAFEALARGHHKTSHWLVMNRVRWEVIMMTTGVLKHTADGDVEVFKIANDHIAFYARLWKHCYPEHWGLFRTKRMVGEPADSPLIG